jgi:site-specific DNA-methyltransferase (adenine-specific)
LKIVLDTVFGAENFRSEIIWKRTTAHNDPKRWGNIHDILLYYTKSDTFTWNPVYLEHSDEYKARFRNIDPDGRRWTDDNLTDLPRKIYPGKMRVERLQKEQLSHETTKT